MPVPWGFAGEQRERRARPREKRPLISEAESRVGFLAARKRGQHLRREQTARAEHLHADQAAVRVHVQRDVDTRLAAEVDRDGRVMVNEDFSLPGQKNIFLIGDMVNLNNWPGVAPFAQQGGRYVAKLISNEGPLGPLETKAKAAGIIDEVVADPVAAAKEWVLKATDADIVKPWDAKGYKMPGGTPYHPAGFMTFVGASAMVHGKTLGVYPAAKALLSAVYEGAQVPFDTALKIEARWFTHVLMNPSSGNMISSAPP